VRIWIAMTGSVDLKPGRWEHKVELLDMQSKTMPPAMLKAVREGMKQVDIVASCVTPEKAAGGVKALLDTKTLEKAGCTFDKVEMAGGVIASEMSCKRPGGSMTVVSKGTYTATEYTVDGESTTTGPAEMTQKTRTTGKWVGECNGTEANKK
jgi:hypothetical protein